MGVYQVKALRKNTALAKRSSELRDNQTRSFFSASLKEIEKNERETAYYFVSEIERCKCQISRLQKTGSLADVMRCQFYEKYIAEKEECMKAKFSEKEIEIARKQFADRPSIFIIENEGR